MGRHGQILRMLWIINLHDEFKSYLVSISQNTKIVSTSRFPKQLFIYNQSDVMGSTGCLQNHGEHVEQFIVNNCSQTKSMHFYSFLIVSRQPGQYKEKWTVLYICFMVWCNLSPPGEDSNTWPLAREQIRMLLFSILKTTLILSLNTFHRVNRVNLCFRQYMG